MRGGRGGTGSHRQTPRTCGFAAARFAHEHHGLPGPALGYDIISELVNGQLAPLLPQDGGAVEFVWQHTRTLIRTLVRPMFPARAAALLRALPAVPILALMARAPALRGATAAAWPGLALSRAPTRQLQFHSRRAVSTAADAIQDSKVIMFSKSFCPYCEKAKVRGRSVWDWGCELLERPVRPPPQKLLNAWGVEYTAVELDLLCTCSALLPLPNCGRCRPCRIVPLCCPPANGPELQTELQALSQQRTVPNIYIKGRHVGGSDGVSPSPAQLSCFRWFSMAFAWLYCSRGCF